MASSDGSEEAEGVVQGAVVDVAVQSAHVNKASAFSCWRRGCCRWRGVDARALTAASANGCSTPYRKGGRGCVDRAGRNTRAALVLVLVLLALLVVVALVLMVVRGWGGRWCRDC